MERKTRVRFAPSPTGPLHIGGVRTALYNYLFAKSRGGDFLLRIEDTDSQRYVPGAEEYIFQALDWCGLVPDEGPQQGGSHAPYRQSERREIYLKYALQLVESGNAYYAFDTADDLDRLRSEYEGRGEVFSYNHAVREGLDNSLGMTAEQLQKRLEGGENWVIRFLMPAAETIIMDDLIRGEISVDSSTLDDKVIYKSADRLPTYHLANIVDDHLMEISHVIRGEEWLPSLPLHYMLYKALGWSDTMPQFAHLPLSLKPTGKGKLSKRDGDKMGFPVFPLLWRSPEGEVSRGYREDGYFPQAFINMLALLGWNPGTEQEIFSMQELIDSFSLEKVGKSGSRFDPQKAEWFNAQYMHSSSDREIAELYIPLLKEHGIESPTDTVMEIIPLIKARATFTEDLWTQSEFFFRAPQQYDPKTVAKFWKGDNPAHLEKVAAILSSNPGADKDTLHDSVTEWIKDNSLPMGQVMNTLRLALVGSSSGPDLFSVIGIIGVPETLSRIEKAIAVLGAV